MFACALSEQPECNECATILDLGGGVTGRTFECMLNLSFSISYSGSPVSRSHNGNASTERRMSSLHAFSTKGFARRQRVGTCQI